MASQTVGWHGAKSFVYLLACKEVTYINLEPGPYGLDTGKAQMKLGTVSMPDSIARACSEQFYDLKGLVGSTEGFASMTIHPSRQRRNSQPFINWEDLSADIELRGKIDKLWAPSFGSTATSKCKASNTASNKCPITASNSEKQISYYAYQEASSFRTTQF